MKPDDRDIICEQDYTPLSNAELVAHIERYREGAWPCAGEENEMKTTNLYLAATFAVVALLFAGTAVLTGMASTWLMALVAAALAVANAAAQGQMS